MPKLRHYCPHLLTSARLLTIPPGKEYHHLAHVLRAKTNDEIVAFNGKGLKANGVIQSVSRKEIKVELRDFAEEQMTKPMLSLACAIPKNSKFETIVEKCTELGIDEIIPLRTQRTEAVKTTGSFARRQQRYEDVAMNACKQSQRFFLPKIHPLSGIDDALNSLSSDDLALIGCLAEPSQRLRGLKEDILKTKNRIIVFIGPEGDFTEQEISSAVNHRCIPITLGSNVLKVETAAIAAISYLNLQFRF